MARPGPDYGRKPGAHPLMVKGLADLANPIPQLNNILLPFYAVNECAGAIF